MDPTEAKITSGKPQKCTDCRRRIQPGHLYMKRIWHEDAVVERICLPCLDLRGKEPIHG
jgi:hypothetical protein